MTSALPHYFVGTYTKVIISNYATLNQILFHRTTTIKDQLINESQSQQENKAEGMPLVLSNQQLDDALNGPFSSFFKSFLNVFSLIAYLQQQIVQLNDEVFASKNENANNSYHIARDKLKKISINDIEMFEQKVNSFMTKSNDEWSDLVNESSQLLIEGFGRLNMKLTDTDLQELYNLYTASELVNRLNDMKVDCSAQEKSTENHLQNYFTLKCKLTLYSYLGREQQQIDNKHIEKSLTSFSELLASLTKKEKEISKRTQKELQDITIPFQFIIKKTKSTSAGD